MMFNFNARIFYQILSFHVMYGASTDHFKIVKTTQGLVKGYLSEGVFTFHGIPYATTPKGSDMFKEPLPPPVWVNTFEAIEKDIACPQAVAPKSQDNLNVTISNDCLIVNLYLPNTTEDKLPVVVLIHGGAFGSGFGNQMTPLSLVKDGNIIFVTFNYRLSKQGFLCLGTDNIPGNAGLKDTISLLKWVNKNIASFGGNPKDVTLTGFSAGGVLASMLMMTQGAQGLCHKVILDSSSSLSSRGLVLDPVAYAIEFAENLGHDTENLQELYEYYLDMPAEIVNTDNQGTPDGSLFFAPCVEQNTSVGAVLTEAPFNLLPNSTYTKVPVLISVTEMEGLTRMKYFNEWSIKMNTNFSEFLPRDLKFENQSDKENIAQKVKEFYFGEEAVGTDNLQGYIDFFSDTLYIHPAHRTVRALVEAGNEEVYQFYYTYRDAGERGPGHHAQATAVYDQTPFSAEETSVAASRKQIKKITRNILLNFVKNGKPVPEGSAEYPSGWPAAGAAGSPYMEVALPPRLRHDLLLQERLAFWDQIYEGRLREPVPPPSLQEHTEQATV